jgi:multidrug resistance efflux pump
MRRVPIPLGQRLADLLRGPVALLVWAGAALGAGWMLLQRPVPVAYVAWVPPTTSTVTAPADGLLASLSVRPAQRVHQGDVLGRLDDGPLRSRLATESARVDELRARVEAAEVQAARAGALEALDLRVERTDEDRRYLADLRRYFGDEVELALSLLELEVKVTTDQVEIERVEVRLVRARQLAEGGDGPEADVEDLALLKLQVEERLARNRILLEKTRLERDAATERLASFQAQAPARVEALPVGDVLAGLRAAVVVQELAVEEVKVGLARLRLVAPMDGQVGQVFLAEGQTVLAGVSVLELVSEQAIEAVLYVDPAVAHELHLGAQVELSRLGPTQAVFVSKVASLAPRIELMPERLWTAPDLPRYGRAAHMPLGEPQVFMPGEVLGARLVHE